MILSIFAMELKWRVWVMWWVTHAIVFGMGRVVFDIAFPFIAASEDIPGLLAMGTAATVLGKVVSGPVCTSLGPYRVGLVALLGGAALLIGVGLGHSRPLLPLWVAWPALRALQTFTWPAANSVCVAWFEQREHGSAWGIMSTAGRVGILLVTVLVGLSGVDISTRMCFVAIGVVMAGYSTVMATLFEENPPRAAREAPGRHQETTVGIPQPCIGSDETLGDEGSVPVSAVMVTASCPPPAFFPLDSSSSSVCQFEHHVTFWMDRPRTG